MKPEDIKAIAETFALICAAILFLYKWKEGYDYVNLSLSVSSVRSHLSADKDLLVIRAKLKKGSRASVSIHEAQARLTWDGNTDHTPVPFVGIHRLSYKPSEEKPLTYKPSESALMALFSRLGDGPSLKERKTINWDKISDTALIRLSPNDEAEFSCHRTIPRNAICAVEVAVLGQVRSSSRFSQWKASHVSTPMA
jgi:hypothetical protein